MHALVATEAPTSGCQAHGLHELLPELVRELAASEPADPYQLGAWQGPFGPKGAVNSPPEML